MDVRRELNQVDEANRRMNEMKFEIFDEDLVEEEED
jgi:hypothetical protein